MLLALEESIDALVIEAALPQQLPQPRVLPRHALRGKLHLLGRLHALVAHLGQLALQIAHVLLLARAVTAFVVADARHTLILP
jgi:endonuclease/exonuclease/phosphatase family metal-dependent hydrolase